MLKYNTIYAGCFICFKIECLNLKWLDLKAYDSLFAKQFIFFLFKKAAFVYLIAFHFCV